MIVLAILGIALVIGSVIAPREPPTVVYLIIGCIGIASIGYVIEFVSTRG